MTKSYRQITYGAHRVACPVMVKSHYYSYCKSQLKECWWTPKEKTLVYVQSKGHTNVFIKVVTIYRRAH